MSEASPTPDHNKICGDPNAPEDKRTSLLAFTVKNSPSSFIHSTPVAVSPSITILFTWVSGKNS